MFIKCISNILAKKLYQHFSGKYIIKNMYNLYKKDHISERKSVG
jgi:hypothetical protein